MSESHPEIRDAVRALCKDFPGEYWRQCDRERAYPTEFVQALTAAGYLAVLIPEAYGGSGLGISEAAAILEEIHKSGGNGAAPEKQEATLVRSSFSRPWALTIALNIAGTPGNNVTR